MVNLKKGMLFEAVAVLLLIALAFLLYLMVSGKGVEASGNWTISGFNQPDKAMFAGENGILYMVSGGRIDAIDENGRIAWGIRIPIDRSNETDRWATSSAAVDHGTLYVIASPLYYRNFYAITSAELLAISQNGKLSWSASLDSAESDEGVSLDVKAGDGHVYAHSGNNETVFDESGNVEWSLNNTYIKPAVDENGTLYVIPDQPNVLPGSPQVYGSPGDTSINRYIEAYSPGGTLKWRYDLGSDTIHNGLTRSYPSLQLYYHNHTVFLLRNNFILALDDRGALLWNKSYSDQSIFPYFDGNSGLVYIEHLNTATYNQTIDGKNEPTWVYDVNASYLSIIYPDGYEAVPPRNDNEKRIMSYFVSYGKILYAFSNGTVYCISGNASRVPPGLGDLDVYSLTAYDIATASELWNRTIKANGTIDRTLNESGAGNILDYNDLVDPLTSNTKDLNAYYPAHSLPQGYVEIRNRSYVDMVTWKGGAYLYYSAYNYEYPLLFGHSKCAYSFGIYSLDMGGNLTLYRPVDSQVNSFMVNNSMIYYSTRSGKLSSASSGAAASFAMTAAVIYLFLRFFLAGAVTRARSIVDKNEKRNHVLKYITDNPGASLYEISRSLAMNLGTVRYHLLILGLNHRIVSCKADDKYVRYFTNAGSYSPEQQLVISLMRRDGLKKVLRLLLENPGLSNVELSGELGLHESAASRYMNELLERGIVARAPVVDGTLAYSIKDEYKGPIAFAVDRLKC